MAEFVLVGYIAETPAVETSKNNIKYVRLKINCKKSNDENEFDTYEVYAWRNFAEEIFEPNQFVSIRGRMQANNYEKDGNCYYNARLVAERIDFYH